MDIANFMENNNYELKPKVREVSFTDNNSMIIALTVGLVLILGLIEVIIFMKLSFYVALVLTIIVAVIYLGFFALMVRTRSVREIRRTKIIEKPATVKEIVREIEKPVYIESPKVSLNIPKYDYLGSTQTKTYHSRNCRLAKLIKNKYKISNNSALFFKRQKFKACKICIKSR